MWMSGYGGRDRPAEGTLTELWAKAMALEDSQGNRFVLVTLDLVGIDRETSAAITAGVAAAYDLPRQAIALSTSHTHSGPVVGDNLRAMYFIDEQAWGLVRRYTAELVENTIAVVGRALDDLQPAQLGWTVGRAHFATNRRNNPEAEVPQRRQAGRLDGPVDHDVPILVAQSPDGQYRGIVCGYACHATVLSGYQWSGDWPGYAQMAIEERFPGAVALVWAGCGADQNPLPRRQVELAQQYGQQIDEAVAAALGGDLIPIAGTLDVRFDQIDLQLAEIPTREQLEATLESENRYEVSRARLLLDQLESEGEIPATYPYPVQTVALGDGPRWVFLGGEVVVDYALRLKLELGAGRTWVAGYCNDVMAYIASRRVLREGGYEGARSMLYYGLPSPWDESIEEAIVAAVRTQVAQLGGPPAEVDRQLNPRPYEDHTDLSVWRDDDGQLQQIETPQHWQRRREDIVESMQWVMGRLPGEDELLPLQWQQRGRDEFDQYTRLLITYSVDADGPATAHLYLPSGGDDQPAKRPAVLALHPTSPLGKRIVAGEGPRPNRNYAAELAERGYIVLAPDYPSFGELDDYNFHTDAYLSGTMKAIANHRRGVDLLLARDDVDPQRIGVIGHSLGGHNAMFLGAFDPRVKAVVSSCGWDPFHHYKGGQLAGWASDRYMPRIREMHGLDPDQMPFDFPEVAAAIAPRGFFSNSPLEDDNFDAQGVKSVEPAIRSVYRLLGAEQRLVIEYPDADHDFPEPVRQAAYRFLDQTLGAAQAPTK